MNAVVQDYFENREQMLSDSFLQQGYVIVDNEDSEVLNTIRRRITELTVEYLGIPFPDDPDAFLNGIHRQLGPDVLNKLRLSIINNINNESWFRSAYFSLARRALELIVGNELAMQRRVNLSIQLPQDDSSLLPLHTDVWSGDSPYEVVLWIPLVDCYRTKSMYIVPPDKDRVLQANINQFSHASAETIFNAVKKDATFIKINYGQIMIFSQTLMHGNRLNNENDTRWSMNCRFKSLMSPYSGKRLGEFFEPITIRPATRMGMNYELPGGFTDE